MWTFSVSGPAAVLWWLWQRLPHVLSEPSHVRTTRGCVKKNNVDVIIRRTELLTIMRHWHSRGFPNVWFHGISVWSNCTAWSNPPTPPPPPDAVVVLRCYITVCNVGGGVISEWAEWSNCAERPWDSSWIHISAWKHLWSKQCGAGVASVVKIKEGELYWGEVGRGETSLQMKPVICLVDIRWPP